MGNDYDDIDRLIDTDPIELGRRCRLMRRALLALEGWDMLTLDADGHGVATHDAPWARQIISVALYPRAGGDSTVTEGNV